MLNDKTTSKEKVLFGNDSVVIRKCIHDIQGGRTLDCEGYTGKDIYAGHVIIKNAAGNYAPMPVKAADQTAGTEAAYDKLPAGASYVGILKCSISAKDAAAAIMVDGVVNPEVVPYSMEGIMTAFKAACPHIIFEKDEEA